MKNRFRAIDSEVSKEKVPFFFYFDPKYTDSNAQMLTLHSLSGWEFELAFSYDEIERKISQIRKLNYPTI